MPPEKRSARSFASRYQESLAYLEKGLSFLEAGKAEEAIAELNMALRYDRENTLAYGNLGLVYRQLGRLDQAARMYDVALELEPRDPWLHRGRGAVYEAQGQLSQAQEAYRRAIELDPTDAEGRFELGNALLGEKKLEAAVDAFCEALEIDPLLYEARNRLASIYRGRGMHEAALEQYSIVVQYNKDQSAGLIAAERMAIMGRALWPMIRRDPAASAHDAILLPPPLGIHWRFDGPGAVVAPIIAFNGVVYAVCRVGREGGNILYALDAVTGEEVWHFIPTGGVTITASPAAQDGLILLGTNQGTLYALDAAVGRVAWQWDTQGAIQAAPVVTQDTVYVGTMGGCLAALDLLTGQEQWCVETGNAIHMAPVVAQGRVFVSDRAGRFRALDITTGRELWSVSVSDIPSMPMVLGPTVFVPTVEHELYALVAATGQRRWIARFKPLRSGGFSDMTGWESRLYLAYGHVLAALDIMSGQIEWEVPIAEDETPLSAPALAGQMLYVSAGSPGRLFAFDIAQGRRRWTYELPYPVTTPPTVIPGAVLLGSAGSLRELNANRRVWAGTIFCLGPRH
ncbi:MAG: PQQ-binding-like beta-propeller repeat protein [Chloroflexi bacterium]|nr:PQQ-binding-like beta-propeller repeat protein [Chloroflexota bacterium]MBU1748412.1 PQQ-binding-like beta-propeller repeat protein [Chloroflexota bacterium]